MKDLEQACRFQALLPFPQSSDTKLGSMLPSKADGESGLSGFKALLSSQQTLPVLWDLTATMNEVKESLRSIEQKYKLFQQQQFTFIAALEHCRENAHDKIRPISSIEQVMPGKCVRACVPACLRVFSPASPPPEIGTVEPEREQVCELECRLGFYLTKRVPWLSPPIRHITVIKVGLETQTAWAYPPAPLSPEP